MDNFWYNYSMDIPMIISILIGLTTICVKANKIIKYLIIFNFVYVFIMEICLWR